MELEEYSSQSQRIADFQCACDASSRRKQHGTLSSFLEFPGIELRKGESHQHT